MNFESRPVQEEFTARKLFFVITENFQDAVDGQDFYVSMPIL